MRDGNSPTDAGLGDATPGTGPQRPAPTATSGTAPAPGDPDAAPHEPGAVQVILEPDRTLVVLSGEVDTDLGPELTDAATEAERAGRPVEVDLHHVTFMDSSGVAFLARLAGRSSARLRLLHVPPTVRFLLDVTHIGDLLDVPDDDA